MKSISTGRSMARARSARNGNAPLSTHTSSGVAARVVGGDLGAELGDAPLQLASGDDDLAEVRVVDRPRAEPTGRRAGGRTRASTSRRRCRRPAHVRAHRRGRRPPPRRVPRRGPAPPRRADGRVLLGVGAGAQPRAAAARRASGRGARGHQRRASVGSGTPSAARASSRSDSSARQVGEPAQEGHDVALGDVVEQRQHLVADAVAAEPGVVVGGVDDRLEAGGVAERVGLVAAQADDRVGRARAHGGRGRRGRCPAAGRAARSRPGRRRCARWRGRARARPRRARAGPGLEVGPVATTTRSARNAAPKRLGGGGHHVGLGGRTGPEAVVDVHGGDLAARRDREHQQRQGVGPAGHGADERRCQAAGNVHRASSSATVRRIRRVRRGIAVARCGPATGPGPGSPARVGRFSGAGEGHVEQLRAAAAARRPR